MSDPTKSEPEGGDPIVMEPKVKLETPTEVETKPTEEPWDEDPTTVNKKPPKRPINLMHLALGLFGGLVIILLFAILWMQSKQATEGEAIAAKLAAQTAAANTENVGARLDAIHSAVIYTDPAGAKKSVADISAGTRYLVDPEAEDPIVRKTSLDTRMEDTEKLVQRRTDKKYLLSVMSKVPASRVDKLERDMWDLEVSGAIQDDRLDAHGDSLREIRRDLLRRK